MLPMVAPQAASTHAKTSAQAARGAKHMCRAFDIIPSHVRTAMHNEISI
jgi:hypothetical protein